ncbi:MAG: DMT family transporter, partial [candidate division WOR-3 bacterium]
MSFAATLVRLTQAPGLVIAAVRMAVAVLLLTPFFLLTWRRRLAELRSKRTLLLVAASGFFLALHFWSWIESLARTSITSSVLLVTMSPIFVTVASVMLFHEGAGLRTLASIALGITGALIITLGKGPGSQSLATGTNMTSLSGKLLAVVGGIMASAYWLIGRRVRQALTILSYAYVTYLVAALVLMLMVVLTGERLTGYTRTSYLYLALLALGPQVLGHTSFNWALRHVTA